MQVVAKFSKEYCDFSIKDNIIIGNASQQGKKTSIAKQILQSFNDNPDFIGMVNATTGEKTTFEQMKNRSIRCALWLTKQGIGKDDVICTSTYIHENDYVPCFASFYVNAIFNPWAYDVNAETAGRFFDACRPKVMFACDKSIDLLAEIAKDMSIDCKFISYEPHPNYQCLQDIVSERGDERTDDFQLQEPSNPDKDIGVILFSSGTTGVPKATLLSYDSLAAHSRAKEVALRPGFNCLWYSYISWISAIRLIVTCVGMRCTRIIHREFDTEETSLIVEKYQANWILWKPYLLNLCCQENIFSRYDYSRVVAIVVAGAKAHRSTLEECRKELPDTFIIAVYGTTELGSLATRQTRNCTKIDSIGFVVKDISLKIVDLNQQQTLGPNEEGEICLKSDSIMIGYLNNPEETRAILDDDGWLHSGDLGYYDENGEISITNRIKELIRTKSYTVAPSEVEAALMQHPSVFECAVIGIDHPIDVYRPLAFVVKRSGAKVTSDELIEYSASKNERHRLTGGVVFVDEIPFNSSGKKCLEKLKEMAKTHNRN